MICDIINVPIRYKKRGDYYVYENSSIWIKIYKALTIIIFFILLIGGVFAGAFLRDINDVTSALSFPIGIISAFGELVFNMLIIQLLNNVRVIRENSQSLVDKMKSKGDNLYLMNGNLVSIDGGVQSIKTAVKQENANTEE